MISKKIKNIFFHLPKPLRRVVYFLIEYYYFIVTVRKLKIKKLNLSIPRPVNQKSKIMFYEICGGGHGGTSKEIQLLAKYLNKDKYSVYLMYSSKQDSKRVWVEGERPKEGHGQRVEKLKGYNVQLVDFDFDQVENNFPYVIHGMNPNIFDVINKENIDVLVVNTDGKSYFPFNLVRNIPIIFLNVFGSYTVQKNVVLNIPYTVELINRIKTVVDEKIIKQLYIPCEKPPLESVEAGKRLRANFGIADSDFVFGRIGRNVDCIFDEIGIRAFKEIVTKYPGAHYLIISPPPALQKIVEDEKIPNVHLLPPTSDDAQIWAFHQANDAYAHFRKDGETFGLNIAEAMMCGKPIISHRSFMWNGHLEYLDASFSRVAGLDDWKGYASFMEEFINLKQEGKLQALGAMAKQKAEKEFFVGNLINKFENWIDGVVKAEKINKSVN